MGDDSLDRVIDNIADGVSIDWAELDGLSVDGEEREYLECLRLVGEVAQVHRTHDDYREIVQIEKFELPPDEFLGDRRFKVERCLGSGAFGTVYQAYDRQRRGLVALKMLTRVDATGLYRLKQEFRALADLSHPNLVSLYELLCEGGRWFISMELIAGLEFVQYVVQSPPHDGGAGAALASIESEDGPQQPGGVLTSTGVARLEAALRQLGEGLQYLHAAGRLHHDIKPANVLVTPEGRVVLLDFGLVTEFGTGREDTIDFGTPAYMSPEHGTAAGFTAATDWYSVGVMLFKALTGTLPFEGTSIEVIAIKRERDAPEPRERVLDVPAHLNELCRRLLSRLPAVRFTAIDSLLRLGGIRRAGPDGAVGSPDDGRLVAGRPRGASAGAHRCV